MTTQPSAVTGVDFVTVFVKDYDAATEFYGTLLGLPRSAQYGRLNGCEFETGSLTLQVMEAAAIGREFVPSTHPIALHVDDVATAREALESHGVRFFGETIDSGVCHMAIFEDPDGNTLMFHNRYAPPSAAADQSDSRGSESGRPRRMTS
ncbi:MAG TPA: VOC family protein [Solirubrobacteraceae bacterium]|jgi:catechol 2,3-dioxygenase-like lactoylglutathione lyase family enzyme